jgi:hypothetical protein
MIEFDDEDELLFDDDIDWSDEDELEAETDSTTDNRKRKKPYKSRRKKAVVQYRDNNGELKPLPPTMSHWYTHYCQEGCEELHNGKFHLKFRKRFRLPHSCFLDLLEKVKEESMLDDGCFRRWRPGRLVLGPSGKVPPVPIELLLLTSLRYLGRGWTFDDLEEATAISEEVSRLFFHEFIKWGSTKLYKEYVKLPESINEATELAEEEYKAAGFPGCIGSMDGTHVEHSRISFAHRQSHMSFKLPFMARSYNLCVSHRRKIYSTTDGHPARWNDKSLVKFDKLATALHEGKHPLCDLPFELYEYNEAGEVVKEKYKGGWLLVDNGYLNWGVTIPPMKESDTRAELRFSKWLEGMRKDVECTFGILKGRWRILKARIRVHGTKKCDQIWKTCCALHNLLLFEDGMDKNFKSSWTGELGLLQQQNLPEAVRAMMRKLDNRLIDNSGMGRGNDGRDEEQETEEEEAEPRFQGRLVRDNSGAIVVRHLDMSQFRKRLIVHFDIAFKKHEISWPVKASVDNPEPAT